MKIFLTLTAFMLSFFILGSCEHEPPAPTKLIQITGISSTDANGSPISAPDPGDWTHDSVWSPAESMLFSYNDTINYAQAADSFTITMMTAYPNPASGTFVFHCKCSKPVILKMALVDEYLTKQFTLEKPLSSGYWSLNLNSSFLKKGFYRLYYVFLNKKMEWYYKGHGDVEIK